MKTKHIDTLHDRVCALCVHLREDTGFLMHLSDVLYGVIELARTGKTVEAMGVAREVASYLAEGHSRSVHQARQKAWADSVKAQPGSSISSIVGDKQVWWKAGEINIRTTQPSVTGYVGIRHDAPKPAATVEQMRAAADKAMMTEDNTYLCAGCGQKTLTDGEKPLGWSFNVEVDGEVYRALCAPCFGTGILKQYNCRDCDSTTGSRVHPAPGWTDVGDGEFICFACAEEEAKP